MKPGLVEAFIKDTLNERIAVDFIDDNCDIGIMGNVPTELLVEFLSLSTQFYRCRG